MRRSLISTSFVSATALLLIWGLSALGHRAKGSHGGLAALIAKTPLSGILIADLCLVMAGTLATIILLTDRQKIFEPERTPRHSSGWLLSFSVLPFALTALIVIQRTFTRNAGLTAFTPTSLSAASGLTLGLAFIFLLQERSLANKNSDVYPEAPGLAALLRAMMAILLFSGFLTGCGASGVELPAWLWKIPVWLALYAAGETIVRLIISWLRPPHAATAQHCCVGNLLFGNPQSLRPAHIAFLLKMNFGIDFDQSWSLNFIRRTAIPVAGTMGLLAWIFSGVVKIDQNQRGVYEIFGVPQTVLGPGLHILLPRPFAHVRLTEFGTILSTVISDNTDITKVVADSSTAEGEPPDTANRLWDNSPEDASYLVARNADGHASFEVLTVNLRILYRVRLSDRGAMDALYNVAHPDVLLRSLARHDLLVFFASETLDGVMATRRDRIAGVISAQLQHDLDQRRSGIEIVAVVIDSIQPPAAAARSWRAVQAAEIKAQMNVAEERARAAATTALAQRDAYTQRSAAQAQSEAIQKMAQADAIRMSGDDRCWRAGGSAFLLERYLAILQNNLNKAAITVVDSRIPRSLLDLRDISPASLLSTDTAPPK
ncbi:SPFH domain-containing protein (plasmid) [Kozakia baliensis]|uniref:SPFH domain-containing protein n=1 Tax=Kozakia baliensis TaxID=153496 RepID=UPI00345C39E5